MERTVSREDKMAKTQKKTAPKAEVSKAGKAGGKTESLKKKLVLNGADIKKIGEEAELLVGGKTTTLPLSARLLASGHLNSGLFHRMRFIPFLMKQK